MMFVNLHKYYMTLTDLKRVGLCYQITTNWTCLMWLNLGMHNLIGSQPAMKRYL